MINIYYSYILINNCVNSIKFDSLKQKRFKYFIKLNKIIYFNSLLNLFLKSNFT